MIKNTLLLLIGTIILSFSANQTEKTYKFEGTISDYNLCLKCINTPDDCTQNERKYLSNKMLSQINKQLADTAKKK